MAYKFPKMRNGAFESIDNSRLFLLIISGKMLGNLPDTTTLSTMLSHHHSFSLTKQNE